MKITDEAIERLTVAAKLSLTEAEKESIRDDISSILEYIKMMDELKPSDVKVNNETYVKSIAFREDEVLSTSDRENILGGAPKVKDGFIEVPNVL